MMIFHAHLGNALSINRCGQCETKGGLIMFPPTAESVSHICGNIMLSYRTDVQVAPFLSNMIGISSPMTQSRKHYTEGVTHSGT